MSQMLKSSGAKEDQAWIYNPDASEKLAPGMTLVVLGSAEQVTELRRIST